MLEVASGGLRQVDGDELHAERAQRVAFRTMAARCAPRDSPLRQECSRVPAQAAGSAGDEDCHTFRISPPTVKPAAVPIIRSRDPASARPVANASWSAVGIDAATWLPCVA